MADRLTDFQIMTAAIDKLSDKLELMAKRLDNPQASRLINVADVERMWGFSKNVQADMRAKGEIQKANFGSRHSILYDRIQLEKDLLRIAKITD